MKPYTKGQRDASKGLPMLSSNPDYVRGFKDQIREKLERRHDIQRA